MPSSNNISKNKAQWTSTTIFGQGVPSGVTNALNTAKTVAETISNILTSISSTIKALLGFLGKAENLILGLISSFLENLLSNINDVFKSGGSFIVIHPWNSKQATTINILEKNQDGTYKQISNLVIPTPVPGTKSIAVTSITSLENNPNGNTNSIILPLKSLTPQQAFNDFFNSFDDSSDSNRPQWTDNDYATGIGLVITTPDISGFMDTINIIKSFLDIPEFEEIYQSFLKEIRTGLQQSGKDIQDIGSDLGHNWSTFISDLSGLKSDISFIFDSNPNLAIKKKEMVSKLVLSPLIGTRHWSTLSPQNLALIADLDIQIKRLEHVIQEVLAPEANFINEIGEAILRKINSIKNILTTVLDFITKAVTSLTTTGFYTFTIPSGLGGVTYVKQAIQSSLDSSPLAQTLNSSPFTLLFFSGVGGATLDTVQGWLNTYASIFSNFIDQFGTDGATLQAQLDSIYNFKYTIQPNFNTTIFKYNQTINLGILSPNAMDITWYFTYKISDNTGAIISQHLQKNINAPDIAIVNKTSYPILLIPPSNISTYPIGSNTYHIDIEMFNAATLLTPGQTGNVVYHADFIVSDTLITSYENQNNNSNSLYAGYQVCTIVGCTAQLLLGLKIIEQKVIPSNSCDILGRGLPLADYTINIIENTGNTSIIGIKNPSGFHNFQFSSINELMSTPFLRVDSLPIILCFNFSGMITWTDMDGNVTVLNLPTCIEITKSGCYTYTYFDGVHTYGPYKICITLITSNQIAVC